MHDLSQTLRNLRKSLQSPEQPQVLQADLQRIRAVQFLLCTSLLFSPKRCSHLLSENGTSLSGKFPPRHAYFLPDIPTMEGLQVLGHWVNRQHQLLSNALTVTSSQDILCIGNTLFELNRMHFQINLLPLQKKVR